MPKPLTYGDVLPALLRWIFTRAKEEQMADQPKIKVTIEGNDSEGYSVDFNDGTDTHRADSIHSVAVILANETHDKLRDAAANPKEK